MMKKVTKGILLVILLLVLATGVGAQWSQDSLENTPICACWGDEAGAELITDGAGGAIVFISAMRYEAGDMDIYAQHITHKGYLLWEECGRPIRVIERDMKSTELLEVLRNLDGGFYAVFGDWCWRNSHTPIPDSTITYFQRYDSLANPLWGEQGIQMTPMNIAAVDTAYGAGNIVPDDKGGIIYMTCLYVKIPGNEEVHYYLQRMNKNGQIFWDSTGVLVHSSYDPDSIHWGADLISDGQGGAIYNFAGALFQRVDSLGNKLWGEDAVELWPGMGSVFPLFPTGDGGAFLEAYSDECDSGGYCMRLQRIDGEGNLLWGENGVQIGPSFLDWPGGGHSIPDGSGGVILLARSPNLEEIYAQRVSSSGQLLWDINGVPVRVGLESYAGRARLCSDDSGGAIIVWEDRRNKPGSTAYDIYAQRVDSSGTVRWRENGIPISLSPLFQYAPNIIPDGSGGAIIAWTELNYETNWDVFGQQVNAAGKLGVVDWVEPGHKGGLPSHFALLQNYPNPFNAATTIRYTLPQVIGDRFKVKGGPNTSHLIPITLKVYNILGEEVVTLVDKRQRAGSYRVVWDGKDNQGKEVGSGIYFCRLKAGRFTQVRKLALIR